MRPTKSDATRHLWLTGTAVSRGRRSRTAMVSQRRRPGTFIAHGEMGNQRVLASQEPMEWLWRTLERYESIQAQLAEIAESADNSAAQVGALRAQMDALTAQTQLMVASGLLPRNLRSFRTAGELSQLMMDFIAIIERHQVAPELIEELLELARP